MPPWQQRPTSLWPHRQGQQQQAELPAAHPQHQQQHQARLQLVQAEHGLCQHQPALMPLQLLLLA